MGQFADQIFAVTDIEEEELYVPEWGVKVKVRGLSGAERDRYEVAHEQAKATGTVRALLVCMTCRDLEGNRIFTDAQASQLSQKSAAALGRLFDSAVKLSAISREDVEKLEGE